MSVGVGVGVASSETFKVLLVPEIIDQDATIDLWMDSECNSSSLDCLPDLHYASGSRIEFSGDQHRCIQSTSALGTPTPS